jgi:hypothetical protein
MRLRRVMRVRVKRWTSLAPLLIGAWSGELAYAAAPDMPASLQACTQEREDSRRLACYDREMGRPGAAPAAAAASTPAPPASPDKSFGLSPEQLRKLESSESGHKAKPETLSAILTTVSLRGDGRMVFTLTNGQVWVQGEAYETFRVNVGDAVTIKPGTLGSFHLYASDGVATRVTRAR